MGAFVNMCERKTNRETGKETEPIKERKRERKTQTAFRNLLTEAF